MKCKSSYSHDHTDPYIVARNVRECDVRWFKEMLYKRRWPIDAHPRLDVRKLFLSNAILPAERRMPQALLRIPILGFAQRYPSTYEIRPFV